MTWLVILVSFILINQVNNHNIDCDYLDQNSWMNNQKLQSEFAGFDTNEITDFETMMTFPFHFLNFFNIKYPDGILEITKSSEKTLPEGLLSHFSLTSQKLA